MATVVQNPLPWFTAGRPFGIDNVTVHHVAGDLTASQVRNTLNARRLSYHEIIARGAIHQLVQAGNRAWHAGDGIGINSRGNDRGYGICVANNDGAPNWSVRTGDFDLLVIRVTAFFRSRGWTRAVVGQNLNGTLNIIRHGQLRNTACPGPWLTQRMNELATRVNANLGATTSTPNFDIVPISNRWFRVTASPLNIRRAPQAPAGDRHLGTLPFNTIIRPTRHARRGQAVNGNRNWFNRGSAHPNQWLSGRFLERVRRYRTTSRGANLRTQARIGNNVIRLVPPNTNVFRVGTNSVRHGGETWFRVIHNRTLGWMASSVIQRNE